MEAITPLPLDDRCPRCGGSFHCGAGDSGDCACFDLRLSPELMQTLRAHYADCLCIACLKALHQGAPLRQD